MKSKILTPLNLGGSKFLLGWIALLVPYLYTKFRDPSSNGVGARGQKAEMQKCALRAHFCTLGAVRPHGTQVRPRPFWPESLGSRPAPVWAVAVLDFFCILFTWRHVAAHTWHVTPRDQHHRRSRALAHLLVFVPSGSASPIRSY